MEVLKYYNNKSAHLHINTSVNANTTGVCVCLVCCHLSWCGVFLRKGAKTKTKKIPGMSRSHVSTTAFAVQAQRA